MEVKEIPLEALDVEAFIEEKTNEIATTVGDRIAVNALSGGVDSSAVTTLAHKALGDRLKDILVVSALWRRLQHLTELRAITVQLAAVSLFQVRIGSHEQSKGGAAKHW